MFRYLMSILLPSCRSYELLHVLEFSSARKRMSVIVKTEDNKLMLLSKGADRFDFHWTDKLMESVLV